MLFSALKVKETYGHRQASKHGWKKPIYQSHGTIRSKGRVHIIYIHVHIIQYVCAGCCSGVLKIALKMRWFAGRVDAGSRGIEKLRGRVHAVTTFLALAPPTTSRPINYAFFRIMRPKITAIFVRPPSYRPLVPADAAAHYTVSERPRDV